MKHRIFIAINLPLKIKQKLSVIQKKLKKLPVRWTKIENLHITLCFLGDLHDEQIKEVCNICKRIGERCKKFEIQFTSLHSEKGRMIWIEGKRNPAMEQLQKELSEKLGLEISRSFRPHITLARARNRGVPHFSKEISFEIQVESIEVMKSELRPEGPKYSIIKSIKLH
jgi:2'-5' RNA ligase